jgi:hypothetical protein
MGLDLSVYSVEPKRRGNYLVTARSEEGLYLFESSTSNRRFISELEMDVQNESTDVMDNMRDLYRPLRINEALDWAKINFPYEERVIKTLEKMKEDSSLWLREG